jgi:hypothetical protein
MGNISLRPGKRGEVEFASGARRHVRPPAERGERGGVGVVRRGLEIREAKVLVLVGANEEQVFALPRCQLRMLASGRHKAAQNLAKRTG